MDELTAEELLQILRSSPVDRAAFSPEAQAGLTQGGLEGVRKSRTNLDLLGDDFQTYKQVGSTGDSWGGRTTTYDVFDPYGASTGQQAKVQEGGLKSGLIDFALQAAPLVLSGGTLSSLTNMLAGVVGNTAAPYVAQALVSGTFGGLGAERQGGSFGEGFGKGAVTGAATVGLKNIFDPFVSKQISNVLPEQIPGLSQAATDRIVEGAKNLLTAGIRAAATGQEIDIQNTLLPAIAQNISDETKYPVGQVNAALRIAVNTLQDKGINISDISRLITASEPSKTPAGKSAALQEPGAGYGGADFGFFDPEAEELAALIASLSPTSEPLPQGSEDIDALLNAWAALGGAQQIDVKGNRLQNTGVVIPDWDILQDTGVIIPDWDISSSTAQRVPVTGTRLQDPQLEFPAQFVDEPRIQVDPKQRIDVTGNLLKGPGVDLPPTNVDPPRIINVREGDVQQVEIVGGGTGGPRTIVDVPDITKIKPDEILDGTKIVEPDLSKDLPGGIVAKPTTPATKPATKPAAETPAGTTTETVTRTPGQPTVHTPIMANVSPFDINSLVMQLADRGMTTDDLEKMFSVGRDDETSIEDLLNIIGASRRS